MVSAAETLAQPGFLNVLLCRKIDLLAPSCSLDHHGPDRFLCSSRVCVLPLDRSSKSKVFPRSRSAMDNTWCVILFCGIHRSCLCSAAMHSKKLCHPRSWSSAESALTSSMGLLHIHWFSLTSLVVAQGMSPAALRLTTPKVLICGDG